MASCEVVSSPLLRRRALCSVEGNGRRDAHFVRLVARGRHPTLGFDTHDVTGNISTIDTRPFNIGIHVVNQGTCDIPIFYILHMRWGLIYRAYKPHIYRRVLPASPWRPRPGADAVQTQQRRSRDAGLGFPADLDLPAN